MDSGLCPWGFVLSSPHHNPSSSAKALSLPLSLQGRRSLATGGAEGPLPQILADQFTLDLFFDFFVPSVPPKFGIGIGQKYRPIRVSVSVSDRNQNSGFGHSLAGIMVISKRSTKVKQFL